MSSHLAYNQDRMGEGREGFFWISPLPDSSSKVLLSAAQKLARPRYLSMLIKGAWAFDTTANATARYQMTQLYDQITLRFKRPNSPIFPQTWRVIVSPICSLLSASKGWRTAKAVCWGRWYKKAKLIANHRLRRTEIQASRLVILSSLFAVYLVGTS